MSTLNDVSPHPHEKSRILPHFARFQGSVVFIPRKGGEKKLNELKFFVSFAATMWGKLTLFDEIEFSVEALRNTIVSKMSELKIQYF